MNRAHTEKDSINDRNGFVGDSTAADGTKRISGKAAWSTRQRLQ